MEFLISLAFLESLTRLTAKEQKAVTTTAFELQANPAHPGLQFHRLDQAKDEHFWSVRVNRDIRLIVHRTAERLLICYADHHDAAYDWAMRRKIERHPLTGAAQLVEIRERVEEVVVVRQVAGVAPPLFAQVSDGTLLGYGVPPEWLADVRKVRDEDGALAVAEHLPQEAGEALLTLASGRTPALPKRLPPNADPFAHPDAMRRFRVLTNVDELARALEFPWEKWTVFLHPAQRYLVEQPYHGSARVSGTAGTGKTVVALHRALFMARQHPRDKILLTTFSDALATALDIKLRRLVGNEPRIQEQIELYAMQELAEKLYRAQWGSPKRVPPDLLRTLLTEAAAAHPATPFSERFLVAEWNEVVDAWQLDSWEAYRDVPRLGRKTRLGSRQREALWAIFEKVREQLAAQGRVTWAGVYGRLTAHYASRPDRPYRFIVVDESQDLGVPELRFLHELGRLRPDSLFFAGDLGQRIFQPPFSWKHLGVDVRGRSHTLTLNYRTSHQIRQQADRLRPLEMADVDGLVESRHGTISAFNGPPPEVEVLESQEAESIRVGEWVRGRLAEGIQPEEIALFVRDTTHLARAEAALRHAGVAGVELDGRRGPQRGTIALSTMHFAKGMEFRAVAVMACDDEVIPLQSRIEQVSDPSDLEEVYRTERHLLYVACTRARDHLLVTGSAPASEFLDDLTES